MDRALPMLDKAVESLKELNKSHIDEVRNFKKPPSGVVLTMEAACIMLRAKLKLKVTMKADATGMKTKPDYWSHNTHETTEAEASTHTSGTQREQACAHN